MTHRTERMTDYAPSVSELNRQEVRKMWVYVAVGVLGLAAAAYLLGVL